MRRNGIARALCGILWVSISPLAMAQNQPPGIFNIREFGARGDAATLDTAAVQSAIDACHDAGGGTVLVPTGDFLIGTIRIKSNVTIRIESTGRLLGSDDIAHYSPGEGVPEGNGNVALIYAANAENIAIEGRGTIDGQGAKFLPGARDDGEREPGRPRAHMIIFYRVDNASVKDVFLTNSSYHCFRILRCRHIDLEGIRIFNRVNFNNDGFHLNSSEDVAISNCNIVCQDDACALFGSNKNITVTNCTFSTRWSVFRFGSGQCENVTVSNCVIYDTYGCPIKMQVRSGDRLENMIFSNLVMNNVTGPIYIGLGTAPRNSLNPDEIRPGGVVRNIMFRGIQATTVAKPDLTNFPFLPGTPISDVYPGEHNTCISLTSMPGQFIENITLSDINITFAGGGTAEQAALRDVPQVSGGEYFACGVLPAYGLYARNVRGLTMNNIKFTVAGEDLRPAMVFDGVENASINGFAAQANENAESLLRFQNAKDIFMTAARTFNPGPPFLRVEGKNSDGIVIKSSRLNHAERIFDFAADAPRDSAVHADDPI